MTDKENLVSKVLDLAGLVDYQSGTVVSRTIVNKKTGTVTLFAFDAGEAWSKHAAPLDALVEIVDGEVEIKISGQPYKLKKGELIIMPANEPHGLKALTKFKMLLTMIKS